MSFTTAASSFVASISPYDRKGQTFNPDEGQSQLMKANRLNKLFRSRRDFLLRATKPVLSNPDSLEKNGLKSSSDGESVNALIEMASVSSDPLPLHVRRELAKKRLRQLKFKRSVDSALNAVDWLAADLAKLMSFAKTLPLFLNDKTKTNDSDDEDDNEDDSIMNFIDEKPADDSSSSYPHCAWPRLTLKVESEAFFVRTPSSMDEPTFYPRCSWPRSSSTITGVETSTPNAETITPPTNPLVLYPRCNWPRLSSDSISINSFLDEGKSSSNNVSNSETQVIYPRCAWPRASKSLVSNSPQSFLYEPNVTATEPLPSPLGNDSETYAARSPWSRQSSSTERLFPRCEWPRQSPTLKSKSEVNAASTIAELKEETGLMTPRCQWPRNSLSISSPVSVNGFAFDSESDSEEDTVEEMDKAAEKVAIAARCGWPRSTSPSSAIIANFSSPPELSSLSPHASLNGTIQLPSVTSNSDSTLSPRCNWPRELSSLKEVTQGDEGNALPSSSSLVLGPRCYWPRNSTAVESEAEAVRASLNASPASLELNKPITMLGPRCNWPRNASPLSSSFDSPMAEPIPQQQVSETVPGPRCNWPRIISEPLPEPTRSSNQPESVLGPRCNWPRHVAETPAQPLHQVCSEPELTIAPRCNRPRNSKPIDSSSDLEQTKPEAIPTVLGPRCAWPRPQPNVSAKPETKPEPCLSISIASDASSALSLDQMKNEMNGVIPILGIREGIDSKEKTQHGEETEKKDENANDVTWPRRLMATTVGLSLMNHFFMGEGGSAFAQPLDGLFENLKEKDGEEWMGKENDIGFGNSHSEKSMH